MNLWLPYAQMQTAPEQPLVTKTQGCQLVLDNGRVLIDGIASWWTACHGYNPPYLVEAITEQMRSLSHVMLGGLIHPQVVKLAKRLCEKLPSPLRHIFFSESGSVSVEIAMKMAVQFWFNQGQITKQSFLHFHHGYHGDTYWTMSVCDPEINSRCQFGSLFPQQYYQALPTTDDALEALEKTLKQHNHTIAACLLEPLLQGYGGMKTHSPETVNAIVTLCHRYDVLVIFDEIFTGFGRTGTLFAMNQTQVPDIVCLSKALTGGMLPQAATVASDKIFNAFLSDDFNKAFMHATTFMGNAIACAAANASLDLFETEPRLAQANAIEHFLENELMPLKDVPGVKDVRVKGAMGAVQCEPFSDAIKSDLKSRFLEDNVWLRPLGDVIYTTPALTISFDELHRITESIKKQVYYWSTEYYRKS